MADRATCPLIVTHFCPNPPLDSHRWVAGFYVPIFVGNERDGTRRQAGWDRLPIFFHGATEDRAKSAAAIWWGKEQDRLEAKEAALRQRLALRHPKREASDA